MKCIGKVDYLLSSDARGHTRRVCREFRHKERKHSQELGGWGKHLGGKWNITRGRAPSEQAGQKLFMLQWLLFGCFDDATACGRGTLPPSRVRFTSKRMTHNVVFKCSARIFRVVSHLVKCGMFKRDRMAYFYPDSTSERDKTERKSFPLFKLLIFRREDSAEKS